MLAAALSMTSKASKHGARNALSPGPATPRDVVTVERNRAESDSAEKRATSGGQRKGPSGERRRGRAPPPGRPLESGLRPPEGPWNP